MKIFLKNCQSCGSDNVLMNFECGLEPRYWAECENCHTHGPVSNTADAAADAWNNC